MNKIQLVFILQSSFTLAVGIGLVVSMIVSDGRIDINHYGEGWIEAVSWFVVGTVGIITVAKWK